MVDTLLRHWQKVEGRLCLRDSLALMMMCQRSVMNSEHCCCFCVIDWLLANEMSYGRFHLSNFWCSLGLKWVKIKDAKCQGFAILINAIRYM